MKVCKLLWLLLACTFASAQNADEIMDKWSKAMGVDAAAKVKTIYMKGSMTMPMGAATNETFIKEGGKVLVHNKIANMMEQTMGCDGTDCYSNDPMGVRLLGGQEKESLLMQNDPSSQLDWRKMYSKVEYKGEVNLDGRKVHHVYMETEAGMITDSYIDAQTFLMVKQRIVAETPMGTVPMEITYKEFGETEGFKYPKTMTASMMNMQIETVVESFEINVPIPDSKFDLPAGLK
ncbi:MAG: hypothetical protein QNK37_30195 [Acidobacteriota bacterium]|nr:hypothetical protein [Acidobacteriota bacterium]